MQSWIPCCVCEALRWLQTSFIFWKTFMSGMGRLKLLPLPLYNLMMENRNLEKNRMTVFAREGARVMTGKNNTVAKQMKDDTPYLISIHCMTHRLVLGTSQPAKGISYISKFKEDLIDFFRQVSLKLTVSYRISKDFSRCRAEDQGSIWHQVVLILWSSENTVPHLVNVISILTFTDNSSEKQQWQIPVCNFASWGRFYRNQMEREQLKSAQMKSSSSNQCEWNFFWHLTQSSAEICRRIHRCA